MLSKESGVIIMENLKLFLVNFAEYLIVFLVFIVAIYFAIQIGVALRKKKNAKEGIAEGAVIEEVGEKPEV